MQNATDKELVLITGSSGLIGTGLQQALVSGYRVVGFDVDEPQTSVPGSAWIECDLTDDSSVRAALSRLREDHGQRMAAVVHLAAYADFSGEPSPMYDKLTVQGTRRLIQGLDGFEVEQFIFSSSLLVMKPVDKAGVRLTEDSPVQGEWPYPESKIEAEKILREERGDIPLVILRIAGVYDDHCHSLPISQHIRRIYEKQMESYFFPGDATHGQPFIHLDDLASCIRRTIERRKDLGNEELFLVAEPKIMSHEALQGRIGELVHGRAWPTQRIPKATAKAGAWVKEKALAEDSFIKSWMIDLADDHYPVAIGRARDRLGWEPTHFLGDALEGMVDDLKKDPRAWYEENKLPQPKKLPEPESAPR